MLLHGNSSPHQTFAEAERHHFKSMEREWEKEKEKILNSLLGSTQELEFPTEAEVHTYIIYTLHRCIAI